jgi:hypothetical protein
MTSDRREPAPAVAPATAGEGDTAPAGVDLLRMSFRDVCFLHWPFDPGVVAATLPPGLSVDTHDGRAWVGVVALELADIRPNGVPRALGRTFPELNLRTYVTHDGDPGVYFYSLDATDRSSVALARTTLGLPYYRAEGRLDRDGDAVAFDLRRTHPGIAASGLRARYEPAGARSTVAPGSRTAFLTERYRFYLERGGRLFAGPIRHRPWTVGPARVRIDRLPAFDPPGLRPPTGEPRAHYAASGGLPVTAGVPRPVE